MNCRVQHYTWNQFNMNCDEAYGPSQHSCCEGESRIRALKADEDGGHAVVSGKSPIYRFSVPALLTLLSPELSSPAQAILNYYRRFDTHEVDLIHCP